MTDLSFETFNEEDIPEMTEIMTRSFNCDSMMHLGKNGGPTGYDNGEFLRTWGLDPHSTQYKIVRNNQIIGGVILWINDKTNINTLGLIFLDPDLQDGGLGLKVWNKIESMYPNTVKWCTETPIYSRRNHHFYINKCGFHLIKIKDPKDYEFGSYIFEKEMNK